MRRGAYFKFGQIQWQGRAVNYNVEEGWRHNAS